uniref:Uncharacterized protein n=1 Tax=Setaria digitata TaxID=48799 RepID=A0A915PXK2_9BILA
MKSRKVRKCKCRYRVWQLLESLEQTATTGNLSSEKKNGMEGDFACPMASKAFQRQRGASRVVDWKDAVPKEEAQLAARRGGEERSVPFAIIVLLDIECSPPQTTRTRTYEHACVHMHIYVTARSWLSDTSH